MWTMWDAPSGRAHYSQFDGPDPEEEPEDPQETAGPSEGAGESTEPLSSEECPF